MGATPVYGQNAQISAVEASSIFGSSRKVEITASTVFSSSSIALTSSDGELAIWNWKSQSARQTTIIEQRPKIVQLGCAPLVYAWQDRPKPSTTSGADNTAANTYGPGSLDEWDQSAVETLPQPPSVLTAPLTSACATATYFPSDAEADGAGGKGGGGAAIDGLDAPWARKVLVAVTSSGTVLLYGAHKDRVYSDATSRERSTQQDGLLPRARLALDGKVGAMHIDRISQSLYLVTATNMLYCADLRSPETPPIQAKLSVLGKDSVRGIVALSGALSLGIRPIYAVTTSGTLWALNPTWSRPGSAAGAVPTSHSSGGAGSASGTGQVVLHLAAVRGQLPAEVKAYTMVAHPTDPTLVAIGSNVGTALCRIGAQYQGGVSGNQLAAHPRWSREAMQLALEHSVQGGWSWAPRQMLATLRVDPTGQLRWTLALFGQDTVNARQVADTSETSATGGGGGADGSSTAEAGGEVHREEAGGQIVGGATRLTLTDTLLGLSQTSIVRSSSDGHVQITSGSGPASLHVSSSGRCVIIVRAQVKAGYIMLLPSPEALTQVVLQASDSMSPRALASGTSPATASPHTESAVQRLQDCSAVDAAWGPVWEDTTDSGHHTESDAAGEPAPSDAPATEDDVSDTKAMPESDADAAPDPASANQVQQSTTPAPAIPKPAARRYAVETCLVLEPEVVVQTPVPVPLSERRRSSAKHPPRMEATVAVSSQLKCIEVWRSGSEHSLREAKEPLVFPTPPVRVWGGAGPVFAVALSGPVGARSVVDTGAGGRSSRRKGGDALKYGVQDDNTRLLERDLTPAVAAAAGCPPYAVATRSQWYRWPRVAMDGTLRSPCTAVGDPFPTPLSIEWGAEGSLVALVYTNSVSLYTVHTPELEGADTEGGGQGDPIFHHAGTVTVLLPSSAVWHGRSLLVTHASGCSCFLVPHRPAGGAEGSLPTALTHGCRPVEVQLTSHVKRGGGLRDQDQFIAALAARQHLAGQISTPVCGPELSCLGSTPVIASAGAMRPGLAATFTADLAQAVGASSASLSGYMGTALWSLTPAALSRRDSGLASRRGTTVGRDGLTALAGSYWHRLQHPFSRAVQALAVGNIQDAVIILSALDVRGQQLAVSMLTWLGIPQHGLGLPLADVRQGAALSALLLEHQRCASSEPTRVAAAAGDVREYGRGMVHRFQPTDNVTSTAAFRDLHQQARTLAALLQ